MLPRHCRTTRGKLRHQHTAWCLEGSGREGREAGITQVAVPAVQDAASGHGPPWALSPESLCSGDGLGQEPDSGAPHPGVKAHPARPVCVTLP